MIVIIKCHSPIVLVILQVVAFFVNRHNQLIKYLSSGYLSWNSQSSVSHISRSYRCYILDLANMKPKVEPFTLSFSVDPVDDKVPVTVSKTYTSFAIVSTSKKVANNDNSFDWNPM